MRDTSFDLMSRFVETYLGETSEAPREVLDLVARPSGERLGLRPLFPPARWRYRGVDVSAADGAELVLHDPQRWDAIADATIDLVVSARALDRFEYPWEALREMARVLRPGGLVCLVVPSAGPEHPPGGTGWRIHGGAVRALAKFVSLRAVEVFTACGFDEWQDTFAVLQKSRSPDSRLPPAFSEAFDRRVAERFYLESFGARPHAPSYYLSVARIMLDKANLQKAAAALRLGLEAVPGNPRLLGMLGEVERLSSEGTPALNRAVAALDARPLTSAEIGAAAQFFGHASAAERRLLVASQERDAYRLREIARLADRAQHFELAALCRERIVMGNRGNIVDLLGWALSLRGAGSLDASWRLLRQARDLQIESGTVNRTTVVQRIIWKIRATTYLEIGVAHGANLLQIEVPRKIAVDPDIRIPGGTAGVEGTSFYPVASERFFAAPPAELLQRGVDVVLVDGLHTADAAFRDVENCLRFLNPGGAIVMHDCLPASEAQACADPERARKLPGFDGSWTGDVYKAVIRLRATRTDLFVCVLDADHGVGIVMRGQPENAVQLEDSAIERLSFAELSVQRDALLNLKPPSWFASWLERSV